MSQQWQHPPTTAQQGTEPGAGTAGTGGAGVAMGTTTSVLAVHATLAAHAAADADAGDQDMVEVAAQAGSAAGGDRSVLQAALISGIAGLMSTTEQGQRLLTGLLLAPAVAPGTGAAHAATGSRGAADAAAGSSGTVDAPAHAGPSVLHEALMTAVAHPTMAAKIVRLSGRVIASMLGASQVAVHAAIDAAGQHAPH